PATAASFRSPRDVAIAPDGSIFVSDSDNHRIRRISPILPGFDASDIAIASEDGRQLYRFNSAGRHLSTQDSLTGAVLDRFDYDAAGRLIAMTDVDGNVTRVERDADGRPTALIAPFGQRTDLSLDTNGYLSAVTNPAGESYQLESTAQGLLTAFTDPNGHTARYSYDASGRLDENTDAAGAAQTLARTPLTDGHLVDRASPLARTTRYSVLDLPIGDRERRVRAPDGTETLSLIRTDGTTAITAPDGTQSSMATAPDPRFGMQSPIMAEQQTTAAGLTRIARTTRTAVLADPDDPLSLQSETTSTTLNGRTTTSVYTATDRRTLTTTPAARTTTTELDAAGRPTRVAVPGLATTLLAYDAAGRLAGLTQDDGVAPRETRYEYDASGNLASIQDAIGRQVTFDYDLAGRVTRQTTPDLREIAFAYDPKGNLLGLTPPGRPEHRFVYNSVDLTQSYRPPAVTGGGDTLYAYDADKDLTRITRPDGLQLDYAYDAAGRLIQLDIQRGSYGYSYNAAGQLSGISAPDGGTLAYQYSNRLLTGVTSTGTVPGSVGFAYDADFRVREIRV
ncbi:MAG: hypothetical protein EOM91_22310, partial [Sphingobacteriia bacterium]|nr:hypothetical protein [Sphingobacteriia bacterium]